MLSFTAAFFALLAASATLALPHAEARDENDLVARDGPSGSVVYPPGGTTFDNLGGAAPNNGAGGIGYIHIQYEGVQEDSPVFAYTVGVDIYLEDPTGSQADQYMAYDFGNPNGALIDGYFSPPSQACGTYNLVFIEHQNYLGGGNIIKFRAASPSITIVCPPIQ